MPEGEKTHYVDRRKDKKMSIITNFTSEIIYQGSNGGLKEKILREKSVNLSLYIQWMYLSQMKVK